MYSGQRPEREQQAIVDVMKTRYGQHEAVKQWFASCEEGERVVKQEKGEGVSPTTLSLGSSKSIRMNLIGDAHNRNWLQLLLMIVMFDQGKQSTLPLPKDANDASSKAS